MALTKVSTINGISDSSYKYIGQYDSFADAIVAIGSEVATLIIDADTTVSTSTTTPTTLTTKVVGAGKFTKSGNGAINFGGDFEVELRQSFVGFASGDITGLKESCPEWWATNASPGVTDMTTAIQSAIASAPVSKWGATTYAVSSISVPANKTIRTAGLSTTLKQISGQTTGTRIINIIGSDVVIGDVSFQGNIAADTGEENHCVIVQSMVGIGAIDNIQIGNIHGTDIRGDVLLLSARTGYPLTNVKVGTVTGNNILRNIVSIVGGTDIDIKSIYPTGGVGLFTLDIEPESYTEPAKGVRVGYVKGRAVGVVGAAASAYADGIDIGYLDLDHAYTSDSTPSFSYYPSEDALQLRNVKTIHIGVFRATGYNRFALNTIYNSGELGVENLIIDQVNVSNCSITDTTYNAYFALSPVTNTCIHSGNFNITGNNKRVFDSFPRLSVSNFTASVGTGAALARAGNNANFSSAVISGTGYLVIGGAKHHISNTTFTGESLTSFADMCTFDTVTATTTGTPFVGNDNQLLRNTTLNTVYWADGPYQRNYLNAIRFGAYYLWVDSGGKLRIKSSVPANDTDGTVVGTQT